MHGSEFSISALRKLIRRRDSVYKVTAHSHSKHHYIQDIVDKIHLNKYEFYPLKQLRVGAFTAYQPQKLGDTLVLRRLNRLIRAAYGLRQADRTVIIKQAKVLLSENCPKYVYKLDIQKFFESIRRDLILDRLRHDGLLSPTAIDLLSTLFSSIKWQIKHGLPRGVAISTTLSELYLKNIDTLVPKIPRVYYYARYVDDILVFSSKCIPNLSKIISSELPDGMHLNSKKFRDFYFGCGCYPDCTCTTSQCRCSKDCRCAATVSTPHSIEYLGYKFIVPPTNPKDIKRAVEIDLGISDGKLNRFKTRIVKAFLDHCREPNFPLLRDRIQFLTNNHRIISPSNRGKLKSGISFNYPLITEKQQLKNLNNFLIKQSFATTGNYGARLSANLSLMERRELAKFCFSSGFDNKRSRRVIPTRMRKIRECW